MKSSEHQIVLGTLRQLAATSVNRGVQGRKVRSTSQADRMTGSVPPLWCGPVTSWTHRGPGPDRVGVDKMTKLRV